MDSAWLEEYEHAQADLARRNCGAVKARGYVASAAEFYPDLAIAPRRAYSRFPVPLPLLLLMYDAVAVYVPPTPPEGLRARWRVGLDDVIELAAAGIVQPLIAHPPDYSAAHFDPLFDLRPPSVWARGLALVYELGMEHTLDIRDCPLPVRDMAHLPEARTRFGAMFPTDAAEALTRRIELDVLTNYADLWVCGEGEIADSLAKFAAADCFGALLTLNEIRTYPILFGLGGTANYALSELRAESPLVDAFARPRLTALKRDIPKELNIFLRTVGIDFEACRAADIIAFHESGQAEALRCAVSEFESEASRLVGSGPGDIDAFIDRAEKVEDLLRQASEALLRVHTRRELKRVDESWTSLVQLGLPAIGAALGFLVGDGGGAAVGLSGAAVGLGAAGTIASMISDAARNRMADRDIAARFSPGIANLWSVVRRADRKP